MTTPQTITPFKHHCTGEVLHPLYLKRKSDLGVDRYRYAGLVTCDFRPGMDEFVGKPDEHFDGAFSLSDVHECHIFKKGTP